MQNKIKLALLVALALLMYSCGDTGNTNPETPIDYFSVKEGDYFIYNSYGIDEDNIEKYDGVDSASVGMLMTWKGQQCNPVTYFSFDTKNNSFEKSIDIKQYSTKEQVFFSGNFISSTLSGILSAISEDASKIFSPLEDNWIKVIDLSKDSFSIFPKNLELGGIELPKEILGNIPSVDPGKITMYISYNADVIKQPNEKFMDKMNNKNVNAVSAKISHKMKISIKFEKPIFGKNELPLKNSIVKLDQFFTFAEDIGLAKAGFPSQTLELKAVPMGMEIELFELPINGFGMNLLRYKKAK